MDLIAPETLRLYAAAALVLVLAPGPDVLLVLSRSLFEGRAAGWLSAAGAAAGGLCHVAFATVGLSAAVAASPYAFEILRWLGAAYLCWIGAQALLAARRAWRAGDGAQALESVPRATARRAALGRAFLTNLLNPKIILFYFAFVPQFMDPARGEVALQTLIFGLILVGLAIPYHLALAAFAAGAAQRLVTSRLFRAGLEAASGLLFLGFALRLALFSRRAATG